MKIEVSLNLEMMRNCRDSLARNDDYLEGALSETFTMIKDGK